MTALEARQQFTKVAIWLVLIALALFSGLLLGTNAFLLVLLFGGTGWLLTLPYHATIALHVGLVMFGAAFIVPFLPGRPLVWEVAGITGWSGALVTLALRRQAPDFRENLRRYRFVFLGLAGYVAVLILLMRLRGTGFSVFGGERVGGRFYLQQVASGIFPFLFLMLRPDLGRLVGLFGLQCLLSLTFTVSDFAFAAGPALYPLLYVFELSNDAFGFEVLARGSGFRRFQSMSRVSLALIEWLMMVAPLAAVFSRRFVWLVPAYAVALVIGLAGGHRALLVVIALGLLIRAWSERLFTPLRIVVGLVFVGSLVAATYAAAPRLPLAAQRTISFLPGVRLDPVARDDASNTLMGRRVMREVAFDLVPYYRVLGRGLQYQPNLPPHILAYDDETNRLIELGHFYNGPIGLLVNTGIPGVVAFLGMLTAASAVALRLLRRLRQTGLQDVTDRFAATVGSMWLARAIFFAFFDGSADFAMTQFALPCGLLLICDIRHREKTEARRQAARTPAGPAA